LWDYPQGFSNKRRGRGLRVFFLDLERCPDIYWGRIIAVHHRSVTVILIPATDKIIN